MKYNIRAIICIVGMATMTASCLGPKQNAMASGGEVTGVSGTAMSEPAPFGMVMVKRGALKQGMTADSLWGLKIPEKEILYSRPGSHLFFGKVRENAETTGGEGQYPERGCIHER